MALMIYLNHIEVMLSIKKSLMTNWGFIKKVVGFYKRILLI